MRASRVAARKPILVVVDLHHVDAGEILLHLLAVLNTLTIDHIVDVLDLIRTDTGLRMLRRRASAQDGLIDRRQLVVLISTR